MKARAERDFGTRDLINAKKDFTNPLIRRSASGPRLPTQEVLPFDTLGQLKLDKEKDSQAELPGGRLDVDQQFIAAFRLAVWVVRRPANELADSQRAALLSQVLKLLIELQMHVTSVKPLEALVMEGRRDLLEVCFCV